MTKRTLILGACLAALALGLAACGGGGSTSTSTAAEAAEESTESGSGSAGNIVEVAEETPELSVLVEAVAAAGLVKTLEEPGPYTVFAPTNEAFEALGSAKLEELLEPQNKKELTEILTYHVAPEEVSSGELENGQMIETVQGEDLEVKIQGEEVKVDGAKVVIPDVAASNGIVHVIDAVLLPPTG
jgi:uncharacterized surface protein with fasciclin (FAS1) repeats